MFLRSCLLGSVAVGLFAQVASATPLLVVIEAEVTSILDGNTELPLDPGAFDQDVFQLGTGVFYAGVFDGTTVIGPPSGISTITFTGNQSFALLSEPNANAPEGYAIAGAGTGGLFVNNQPDDDGTFDEAVFAQFTVDMFEGQMVTPTIAFNSGPLDDLPLIGFGFGLDEAALSFEPFPSLVQEGDTISDFFTRLSDADSLSNGSFDIEFGTQIGNGEFDPRVNISSAILSLETFDTDVIPDLEEIIIGDEDMGGGDMGGGDMGGGDMGGGGDLSDAAMAIAEILDDFASGGGLPAAEIPGIFELPDGVLDGGFLFNGVPITEVDPTLFDPEIAIGYDYEITGGTPGTFFDSVLIPTIMGDDMFTISPFVGGDFLTPIDLMADTEFDLSVFGDISLFRVEGIDPALELDPGDFFAFPTLIGFNQDGTVDISQTPLTVDIDDDTGSGGGMDMDVPEPATLGLFGFAAAGLALARRRRTQASC